MTIKRIIDGKEVEIELTNDEIETAYRTQELHYYMEDVRSKWIELYGDDETECLYNKATVEQVAEYAMRIRGFNDYYWEGYWSNIETAIIEYENNRTRFMEGMRK